MMELEIYACNSEAKAETTYVQNQHITLQLAVKAKMSLNKIDSL